MNEAILAGRVVQKPEFSHELFGETFYEFKVATARRSGTVDVLSCLVSERLVNEVRENEYLELYGEVRSHRMPKPGAYSKLLVQFYTKEIGRYKEDVDVIYAYDANLHNAPVYRETPKGRKITSFLMQSHREVKKTFDLIPVVCWGLKAKEIAKLSVGDKVSLTGRLQSRQYTKVHEDGSSEELTTYEVSVHKICRG